VPRNASKRTKGSKSELSDHENLDVEADAPTPKRTRQTRPTEDKIAWTADKRKLEFALVSSAEQKGRDALWYGVAAGEDGKKVCHDMLHNTLHN
jgi:hypothetical protein